MHQEPPERPGKALDETQASRVKRAHVTIGSLDGRDVHLAVVGIYMLVK